MSERPFEDLHRELQARLEQRLDAIEQEYRAQAEAQEKQLTRSHRRQVEEARQNQKYRLQRRRLQEERQWRRQAEQRIWACQRACIDELLEEVRRQLQAQPAAQEYLEHWRSRMLSRLPPSPGELRLRLSPAWAQQLGRQELEVTTAPLLGGAVLEVPRHHLEIDGSWDRRLQDLTPQLWQRWLQHVGKDDSN